MQSKDAEVKKLQSENQNKLQEKTAAIELEQKKKIEAEKR